MGNFYLIIVDGLGVGAQEDAKDYGDESMNTLVHVSKETGCKLTNLSKMGIGNIIPLHSVPFEENPTAAYGKMREVSGGKDSTTGHWEIAGVILDKPFPTYPYGFPNEVIDAFCDKTGVQNILCNLPFSGTDVINEFGEEHLETGNPIVYTSADSVFQVACHVSVTPISKLHEWCEMARNEILVGEHSVGRVIARPFTGEVGNFYRISDQRHDYSVIPPENNVVNQLFKEGIKTHSIGKVIDLFAGVGFSSHTKTKDNKEGIATLLKEIPQMKDTFVFMNLIDTDQLFGHRLDPKGYAKSLEELDASIPQILSWLKDDDVLVITGDHGNDPCSESTDHSREFTPLLVYPIEKANTEDLGTRETFSDIAVSASQFFGKDFGLSGKSFLKD